MDSILFRITNGYYYNITYTQGQILTFNFNILDITDVFFRKSLFDENPEQIKFREFIINTKCDFDCTYTGIGVMDCPMFSIDYISEYRNINIRMLLDQKENDI
jgi:hypothetical protein